jgi:hypothetical protein
MATGNRLATTAGTSAEHAALMRIIDACNANPEPIHYKVREAIEAARMTIQKSDMNDGDK